MNFYLEVYIKPSYMGALPAYTQPSDVSSPGHSIFVDEPELDNVALGFGVFSVRISQLIRKSSPRFTVAIYGDWGTGKSTLLENIEKHLAKENILCVNFNAWRFENEQTKATVPLMLVIIDALLSRIEKGKLETLKERGIKFLKAWSFGFDLGIISGNLDLSKIGEGEDKLKKPQLQEGLNIISELIKENTKSDHNFRIIVFIDDLDRCLPDKALEVLESIKIFFNMKGIIFVLGLNREVITSVIEHKYQHLKKKFSGDDYLKKIVQVQFNIPPWKEDATREYVESLLKNYADTEYSKIFKDNIILISQAAEPNPREVKRYLNTFILSKETYGKRSLLGRDNELLAMQALQLRWPWFYYAILDDIEIRNKVKKIIFSNQNIKEISREIAKIAIPLISVSNLNIENIQKNDPIIERVLSEISLIKFLKGEGRIIFDINSVRWSEYRLAGMIVRNQLHEWTREDMEELLGLMSKQNLDQKKH